MKEEIRRAVISVAVKNATGEAPSNIYSYGKSKYSAMSSTYDYDAGAHFSDGYHYGVGSHFLVTVKDNEFSGYDYGDGHHFSGSISGRSVQLYDYGTGNFHQYSI